VNALVHYDRSWLRGDLLAGITVAAYLVPQVMAYAEVAGLPAAAGLSTVVAPLLVYAIFGSSRQLSLGPEATTSLMTGVAVASMLGIPAGQTAPDPARYAQVAAVVAVSTGLICVLGYLARLGFLADLLSRPVLVGYMIGVAVLMIVSQLGKVTGVDVSGEQPWDEVVSLALQLAQVNTPTLVLAVAVVAALFVFRRWFPGWPGPLIVMVGAAAIVHLAGLDALGVELVGRVSAALPGVRIPSLTGVDWMQVLPAAVGIAIVGYSDTVLTGRAFASKRQEETDANQEWLALGLANLAAGLTHGFPVSSSASRTALGESMGSRTQLHSLVALAVVLAATFFLGPVLAGFPRAALGGVVIYAALRLIDLPDLRRLRRFRMSELILALATAACVVGFGVLIGIGVAVVCSMLDVLRRIAKPHAGVLGFVPGLAGMHDVHDYPHVAQVPGLVVFRYDSPIFFANADDFRHRAVSAVDSAPGPVKWFVLNCEANTSLDLTAIDALADLRRELSSRGIVLALARLKRSTRADLDRAGFGREVAGRIYPTLPTAVDAYVDWVEETTGERPPWADAVPQPPPLPGGLDEWRYDQPDD